MVTISQGLVDVNSLLHAYPLARENPSEQAQWKLPIVFTHISSHPPLPLRHSSSSAKYNE